MDTEGRKHGENNYAKIEKDDRRLAPGVGAEAALARERRTNDQASTHEELEEQNAVRIARSLRAKESFVQVICLDAQ
jgi:hypothetical protein